MRKVSIVSMMLVVGFLAGCKEEVKKPPQPPEPKEKVSVEFFVMSQCPFGVQVENAIKPVLDELGKAVDFKINFIGDEPNPGQLTSMHGENEVKGDLQHICAQKYFPDKFMNLIVCQNKNMRDIPNNFDECAKEAGIDGAKVKACAEGDEGKRLLSESFKYAKEKGARGSPTIFIAGERYQRGRQTADFKREICQKFKTEIPEPCKNLPKPKDIPMVVLMDSRCKDCRVDPIVNQLKNFFPGLQPKTLDYTTPEGKEFYDKMKDKGVRMLPAFLFASVVTEDPGFSNVQRYVQDAGEYKLLQIGSRWDPTAEICDNKIDDDGNGKIDCEDPGCTNNMVCREEKQKQLEVFVMSQCPFGIKALNSMKEVLDAFEKKIDFKVHFIMDENQPGQFSAMHGQGEVDENIRELCVINLYPKNYKWMEYIWCRNQDIRGDWKKCVDGNTGFDSKKIEACATGEQGKKLASEDLKIAKSLGIGASPTWLANNKYQFSGLSAEDIKRNFCNYNKDLKGCEKTLSSEVQGPSGGCGSN